MPILTRPIRVIALTGSNHEKTFTWQLRGECLLPYLRPLGVEVETARLPRRQRDTWELFDRLRGYDIAWLHRRTFWPSDLRRLRPVARHLVLDIDDPINLSSTALFNFSLGRCLKFRATTRACSAVLAASDGLVELTRPHNPHVHLVPLCANPAAYSMQARPRPSGAPLRLLWMGSTSTFKYLTQVRPHLELIGKECRGVELTVIGHAELRVRHLRLRNLSWSPATERQELDNSHVGLVPMIRDRWTMAKAAFKPLQYLASGLPFIGSRVGVNVRLADGGKNGLLADSPREWVQAVQRLRNDEVQRYRMGCHGVEYVRKYHSPEVLAARVAEIFAQLLSQGLSHRAA